ncbi:MAG: polysaccharide deacetylase family protein [Gammaproteobacteria bacterium]
MSKTLSRFAIFVMLLWPVLALAVPSHAVVFMYHRFGDDRFPSTNVKLEQFESHLDYLADNDYEVWPLDRIMERLQCGRSLPDKVVAITIDDAYLTVYEEAFPRLKERGWPYTVFVSSDPVDQGLDDYMTWSQIREMQAAGAAIANHGASHEHLVLRQPGESEKQWRARVRADIEKGQRRLHDELGPGTNELKLFAYPFGEYDRALADLLEEMEYIAFGQHSGAIGVHSDKRRLPRYPVNESYAALDEFARKAASLPLPVLKIDPDDPLVDDNPPRLVFTLDEGAYAVDQLACYAGGQGRIRVESLDNGSRRFLVQAQKPFAAGRARYNCTAPAHGGGRWYWYSHPWLIPPIGDD